MDERMEAVTFVYNEKELKSKLSACIAKRVPADAWQWLEAQAARLNTDNAIQNFRIAFSAITRKTEKEKITLSSEDIIALQGIRPNVVVQHWAIDRLCRVWLLLHLAYTDQTKYIHSIESLFPTAEMSEQVALYSALPLLAYPASWRARCAEGIRSNIADVLESIICNNPYPSENLDEPAWNQLVLKALFTGKPVHEIINLDKRANPTLANTLVDYAHERWAAHRTVHPLLWWCVGKFISEKNFAAIQRISFSEHAVDREAAALACQQSTYPPAHKLVEENNELQAIVKSGLTWVDLAKKLEKISI